MKKQEVTTGWVIASMNGKYIIESTFARTRSESIKKWMAYWDPKRTNWRKQKREGYSCVKAKQTTELL